MNDKRKDTVVTPLTQSLTLARPVTRGAARSAPGDQLMTLPINRIKPFESNPRTAPNSEYEQLRESIRRDGLHHPFRVTQRPGEELFTIESGGNTRLQILQELFEETGDSRFEEVVCLVRPYESESAMQIRHVVENTLRGAMSFWDTARAVMRIREQLESERGSLSQRDFEGLLAERGLAIKKSHLALYAYATRELHGLGSDALARLSATAVISIQPHFNALRDIARRAGCAVDIDTAVLAPAIAAAREHVKSAPESDTKFPLSVLFDAAHAAIARHLGVLAEDLPVLIAQCKRLPNAEWEHVVQVVAATKRRKSERDGNVAESTPAQEGRLEEPSVDSLPIDASARNEGEPPPASGSTTLTRSFHTDVETGPEQHGEPNQSERSAASVESERELDDEEYLLRSQMLARQIAEELRFEELFCQTPRFMGWYLEPRVWRTDIVDAASSNGWVILSMISLQHSPAVWQQLPESSLWRRIQLVRAAGSAGSDPDAEKVAQSLANSTPLPGAAWASWLIAGSWYGTAIETQTTQELRPHDVEQFFALLQLQHDWLRTNPGRFGAIQQYTAKGQSTGARRIVTGRGKP